MSNGILFSRLHRESDLESKIMVKTNEATLNVLISVCNPFLDHDNLQINMYTYTKSGSFFHFFSSFSLKKFHMIHSQTG